MLLRIGDRGDEVSKVQEQLKALGLYPHKVDGSFGAKTQSAVVAFQERYLVDGLVDQVTADAIELAVIAWSNKERTLLLPVPRGLDAVEQVFGVIEYTDAGAGAVVISNGWAEKSIVEAIFPVIGKQLVHSKMVSIFQAVFQNVKDKGLDGLIKQFGCWTPRHKRHDSNMGLSTHSWGIACDINWATNAPQTIGDIDPGIVESFERFGFEWGGRWTWRDPMHFQYCAGY